MYSELLERKRKLSKRELTALMLVDFSSVAKGVVTIRTRERKYYVIQLSYDYKRKPKAFRNWVIEQWTDSRGDIFSIAHTTIGCLNGLVCVGSTEMRLFEHLLCCGKMTEEYACKCSLEIIPYDDPEWIEKASRLFVMLNNAGLVK